MNYVRHHKAIKIQHTTKQGTGRAVLQGLDMRSHGGRRYAEVYQSLIAHCSGATPTQELLIRRAAALNLWAERQEAVLAAGDDTFDVLAYTTATNALNRLMNSLGLRPQIRDITPDLAAYIDAVAE
jgi:hypothetical protein